MKSRWPILAVVAALAVVGAGVLVSSSGASGDAEVEVVSSSGSPAGDGDAKAGAGDVLVKRRTSPPALIVNAPQREDVAPLVNTDPSGYSDDVAKVVERFNKWVEDANLSPAQVAEVIARIADSHAALRRMHDAYAADPDGMSEHGGGQNFGQIREDLNSSLAEVLQEQQAESFTDEFPNSISLAYSEIAVWPSQE